MGVSRIRSFYQLYGQFLSHWYLPLLLKVKVKIKVCKKSGHIHFRCFRCKSNTFSVNSKKKKIIFEIFFDL